MNGNYEPDWCHQPTAETEPCTDCGNSEDVDLMTPDQLTNLPRCEGCQKENERLIMAETI